GQATGKRWPVLQERCTSYPRQAKGQAKGLLLESQCRLCAVRALGSGADRDSMNFRGYPYMPKVRVAGFGVSLDGFSAGTEQSLNDPLGKQGPEIFQWFFHTQTFRAMHRQDGGSL